jgi:hypothetical protein
MPALLFALTTFFSAVAFAEEIIDTGAPGTNGASGFLGKPGANGGSGHVAINSTDIDNAITASGGKGGNGGAGLLLLPGGKGGAGGAGTAQLVSGGQDFPPDSEISSSGKVTAAGGDGGNGGAGLIKGDGGGGGAAQAAGTESGNADVFGTTPVFSLLVNAAGGKGGSGLNGGAGGGSAASSLFTAVNGGATVVGTALGGAGGNATLKGGKGGNASAESSYDAVGQPSDNSVTAKAIGGTGGTSGLGLNGNGGTATAAARGSHASRGGEIVVSAEAVGGNSGQTINPLASRGNGGDAFAEATAAARNLPVDATALSKATGGDGMLRGGNAVATAIQSSAVGGNNASADASGGSGKAAGAAIATASASNDDGFGITTSISAAHYAGKFVRAVNVTARTSEAFRPQDFVPGVAYTQARVGDTSGLLASAPAPTDAHGVAARAAAPAAAEAHAALADNPTAATAFAGGSVWGIGDFSGRSIAEGEDGHLFEAFDSLTAISSYTFDISAIANPQHLLLGLLDSDLAGDSIGNFHFSVAGEGTTFFEHDFGGADFLSFFDDRVFDLGTWANLVGTDGLLNLDVAFSGYVPEIEFAFGAGAAGVPTAVSEPSALALLLAGTLGLLLSRNRQALAGLRSAGFGAMPRRPGRSRSASRYPIHRKLIIMAAGCCWRRWHRGGSRHSGQYNCRENIPLSLSAGLSRLASAHFFKGD